MVDLVAEFAACRVLRKSRPGVTELDAERNT